MVAASADGSDDERDDEQRGGGGVPGAQRQGETGREQDEVDRDEEDPTARGHRPDRTGNLAAEAATEAGTGTPADGDGSATRDQRQRQHARPDGAVLTVVGLLGRAVRRTFDARAVQTDPQDRRGRQLLAGRRPHLVPPPRHEVLRDDEQRRLLLVGRHGDRPTVHDDAAVVGRAVEDGPREDQAVDVRDADRHLDALGRQEQPAARATRAAAASRRRARRGTG